MAVGDIVGSGMRVYGRNFATLVKVVAVVVVPITILRALIVTLAFPDASSRLFDSANFQPGTTPDFEGGDIAAFVGAALVTAVLGAVSSQLATAASLKAVINAYLGVREDWRESVVFAFRRLGALVWLAFLVALLVGVGFLLCIVPGVYFLASTSVAIPVLLVEGTRGWSAVGRSRNLVRGTWWHVFGVLVVAFVLALVVNTILGMAFGAGLTGQSTAVAAFGDAVTMSVGAVLTTPFLAAVVGLVYFDLRVRKEGFDLEQLAEQTSGD